MSDSKSKGGPLDSIISMASQNIDSINQTTSERRAARQIAVNEIKPSPYQARRDFSGLEPLVESVKEHGVLQPVLVRPLDAGGFELIAGERRLRASQEAELDKIPAIVRTLNDEEARLFSLLENLQRQDLNAYEIAQAVVELAAAEAGETAAALTDALGSRRPSEEVLHATEKALGLLGKDLTLRTFQRHYLPLLRLPERLVAALEEGVPYTAILMLRKATDEQLDEYLPRLKSGEWGKRDVEEAMRQDRAQDPDRVPREQYDWGSKAKELRELTTEERLLALDGRRQRKARRLLEQLTELMRGAAKG